MLFAEFLKDIYLTHKRKYELGTYMLEYFSSTSVGNGQCTRKDAVGKCVWIGFKLAILLGKTQSLCIIALN